MSTKEETAADQKRDKGREAAEESTEASPGSQQAEVKGDPKSPTDKAPREESSHVAASAVEVGGEGGDPPAEPDRPRVFQILMTVGATFAVLFGIVIGMSQLYTTLITDEVQDKVLGLRSGDLRELHAQEEAKLTHYQWVSQKDGVVRIPLPRATELMLEEYRRPPPPRPVSAGSANSPDAGAPAAVDGGAPASVDGGAPTAAADAGAPAPAPASGTATPAPTAASSAAPHTGH